jgi:hypothetical protein
MDLFVYQQVVNSNGLLRKAEPIIDTNALNKNKIE